MRRQYARAGRTKGYRHTPHATLYRKPFPLWQRRRWALCLTLAALVISAVGAVLLIMPSGMVSPRIGRFVACLAIFPLMFLVFVLMTPQMTLRVTRSQLQVLRTGAYRRREIMKWNEIGRVGWYEGRVYLQAQGRTVWLNSIWIGLDRWSEVRQRIKEQLSHRFNLDSPSSREKRGPDLSRVLIYVLVAANLVVIAISPFVSVVTTAAILFPIMMAMSVVVIWRRATWRFVAWRYPIESGERRWTAG